MKLEKRYIILALLLSLSTASFARTTFRIRNQEDFDSLQELLLQSINSGEKVINVIFLAGSYVAKEKHIALVGIEAVNTKIRFKGNGATIVPQGNDYKSGDIYVGRFSPYNSWMSGSTDIDVWSNVRYVSGQVNILDLSKKSCCLKSREPISGRLDPSGAFILIPHGYQSSVYKIDKFEDGFIYFTASDLAKSAKSGYNINDDFNYHGREIRYKLSNVLDDNLRVKDGQIYLPTGIQSVREGVSQHVLYIEDCTFHSITIEGLQILGNQSNTFVSSRAAFYLKNVQSKVVLIQDCAFCGLKINAISVLSTPNVRIERNSFTDCYYNVIESDNGSSNTIVRKNSFENMGKRMQNSFCVICRGTDYSIKGNTFVNYGYSAIGVGVWYKDVKDYPSNGVIESNELKYTDDYVTSIDDYGIMDGGAIYLWTKNDGAIIRNNYINNYTGAGDNRGVFCDDGAYNFQVYGNFITGIDNSFCIDSRRVSSVEATKSPQSGIDRSNVNIVIRDNYIDGAIQFVGNEVDDNGCVKGRNYIFSVSRQIIPDKLHNVTEDEDVRIESAVINNGNLFLNSSEYRVLRRSSGWMQLKKYVRKK